MAGDGGDPKDQDPGQDPKDQDPGKEDPKDQDPADEDGGDGDGDKDPGQKKTPKDQPPEVSAALRRRDAALKRAQKAEEETRKLREKYEPAQEDPEKRANRKLVAAEARVVLTKAGVEPEDQKVLMDVLGLEDVDVDTDGTVDSDSIQERLDAILAVVKKLVAAGGGGKRTPRVDTRDRGGEKEKPTDAAKRRRMEMLKG